MVNAAKRMRALTEKVYKVRNGAGSVVLPSGSRPTIKSIYMRIPTGEYANKEYFQGARDFWHRECRRLKYWNPAMATTVDTIRTGANEPMYLTVQYESSDQEALSQLKSTPLPKPQLKVRPMANSKSEAQQKERDLRHQSTQANPDPRKSTPEQTDQTIAQQLGLPLQFGDPRKPVISPKDLKPIKMTPAILAHAPKDDIQVKAQPASDPSIPQSTSAPQVIYTRTLTLPLAGLRHHEIWNWIRQHTGLPDHRSVPGEEQTDWLKVAGFKRDAKMDKKLVKTGVDAMKREEMELKKAREAAERMAQDV